MHQTAELVAGVLAVLLALEILNALFDSVCEAVSRDLHGATPRWAAPFALLRRLLFAVTAAGRTTSLITHELSHAAAQLAFGGRPRVVLLKNGGYAQARPWANVKPLRALYGLGGATGLGVICAAPILAGSALLVVTLVATTPLGASDVIDMGRTLGAHGEGAVHAVLSACWHALATAPWWAYPILVVVPLLLAPSMTPSTVDYVYGALHLGAYGIGAIACAAIGAKSPTALWFVALGAAPAGIIGAANPRFPGWLRRFFGGLGLGSALIALAMAASGSPVRAIQTALGTVLFALGIAALAYVAFVAVFLALSLISVRPRTLWYALAAAPRNLIDLVRPFQTCETCRIHYRGTCEGCGRKAS